MFVTLQMENDDLDLIITRVKDSDREIQRMAISTLHDIIRSTTGTVSAKQQQLFDMLGKMKDSLNFLEGEEKKHMCDLISVLSIGIDADASRNVLKYRVMGNVTDLECWGHQYIKHLIIAINNVVYKETEFEKFEILVEPITEFLFKHNSEVEAIDFLLEIGDLPQIRPVDNEAPESNCKISSKIKLILKYVDEDNYNRIHIYLEEMSRFFNLENIILELNRQKPTKYLVYLIKYNRLEIAIDFVKSLQDLQMKKQCLYILAKCNIYYPGNSDEKFILTNNHISKFYLSTIESLEIMKCKKMDYVLKGLNNDKIEVAAICNGLIHFGYSRDPLFLRHPEDYNIKPEYLSLLKGSDLNAIVYASAGLINAYSPIKVTEMFSEGIYEKNDFGAILALAIASYKTFDSSFEVLALLDPFLNSSDPEEIIISLFVLGIMYSGQFNKEIDIVGEKVTNLLTHENQEVSLMAIYVLGTIYYGSGNMEVLGMCSDIYMELNPESSAFSLLGLLGMALFLYNKPELQEDKRFLKIDHKAQILAIGLMNIGTGCPQAAETILTETMSGDSDSILETIGLIALTLLGVGDSVATQMVERIITSSQMLNSKHITSAIPLCMALLYPSTAKHDIIDLLEKSLNSRACNTTSVLGLGIVGAGTNSSRILGILSSNFNALYQDNKASCALIYAQGLLNMGKGMITLNPLSYDRQIIIPKSIIGLLSTVIIFLEDSKSIFKNYSHLLFSIIQAANPKYCTGFAGEIRVGKPVDVVGLTGKPNTISGAVNHTMPVVLNAYDKAEVTNNVCTEFIEDILVQKEE